MLKDTSFFGSPFFEQLMHDAHHLGMGFYVNFLGRLAMDFSWKKGLAPMAIEKIKILGAVLELHTS